MHVGKNDLYIAKDTIYLPRVWALSFNVLLLLDNAHNQQVHFSATFQGDWQSPPPPKKKKGGGEGVEINLWHPWHKVSGALAVTVPSGRSFQSLGLMVAGKDTIIKVWFYFFTGTSLL